MSGASDEAIRAAERSLGVSLPDDYKRFVRSQDGLRQKFGEAWLMLYPVDQLAVLNAGFKLSESHPGLLVIGSDGGGEAICFDLRSFPPPVLLVPFISSGWQEGIIQARSFDEFMDQRRRADPFDFGG